MNIKLIVTKPDGSTEGVNPNDVPREQLVAEFPVRPIPEAIRAYCLECSGYQVGEIRKCAAVSCALWPYRMGTNPFSTRLGKVENLRKGSANDRQPQGLNEEAA